MGFFKHVSNIFNFKRSIFIGGLIAYGLTAYNSVGFHHEDEHFQILEPTLHISEGRTLDDLPWEFSAQMRPTLQIWLTFAFSKICDGLKIMNRFDQATLMRIALAIVAFLSLWRLTANFLRNVKSPTAKFAGLVSVAFLWFMPYLHCRNSSELMSALAFVVGINILFRETVFAFFWGGFFFGASFWLRFQTAFMILPFSLYLLCARAHWRDHFGFGELRWRNRFVYFAIIVAGAALCSMAAVIADRLFYGEWVLTPWRYFHENILNDKASSFGVAPWWGYLRSFFKGGILPIALLLFGSIILFIFQRSRSFITWIFIFFLVIHFLIPHKELRFLFPLAIFLPIIVANAADFFQQKLAKFPRPFLYTIYLIFSCVIAINFSALCASALLPAEVHVEALRIFSRADREHSAPVSGETQYFSEHPFKFFARNLSPNIFVTPLINNMQDREHYLLNVGENIPTASSRCKTVAQSWWPQLPKFLDQDVIYTNRFAPYILQKCLAR